MSLRIHPQEGKVVLFLSGCTGCSSPQCGHFKTYEWKHSDKVEVNFVGRLAIELFMGRETTMAALLQKFNEKATEESDGFALWEELILLQLGENPTWKSCPLCEKEYKEGGRDFGKFHFIIPSCPFCPDHKI